MFDVGDLVTPTVSNGFFFKAGKLYQVVKVNDAWCYIPRDDGYGFIGVNPIYLLLVQRKQNLLMCDPDFSLAEIHEAEDIIRDLP